MKQKTLQSLLLVALFAMPWAAGAQITYQSLPYSTGFEGLSTGSQPDGWTAIQTGVNGSTTFPCAYSWSGNTHNGDVYYEFESSGSSSDTEIVALPYMQNINSLKLTMWVSSSSSYPCSLEVGVLEADNSFSSLDTLDLITFSGSNGWKSNYHEYTVYTSGYAGTGERLALRAIRTGSGQFTLFLDDLSVSLFTGCYPLTDLVLTDFDASSITIGWADSLNDGATYTVRYCIAGSDDTTTVSGIALTEYTATGLDANTTYDFMVIADCSATSHSDILAGSFKTDCTNGSCDLTVQSSANYSYDNYCPELHVYQGGSELVSVKNATQLVSVCSGDPVTIIYGAPTYSWYNPSATILDGGGTELFSGGTGSYSTGDTLLNIAVPCPSCIPPLVTVESLDSENVTLSWVPRSTSTGYVLYVDGEELESTTDTSYTFSGLTENTQYVFGVQSICSADDSSNVATISVRTACGTMPIPLSVDWEDIAYNGAWPECWTRILNHNSDPSVNNNNNHTPGGTYSMFMLASYDYNMFASREVPLPGNDIYVRFAARLNGSGSWIKAGVMTNIYDTSTFIPMVEVSGTDWAEYEFTTDTLDATETYYIAWLGYGTSSWSALGHVDDIYIDEIPSCMRVTDLVADSVDSTMVIISWVDSINSGATYTVVNLTDSTEYTGVVGTTYTFTDLNPSTGYTFSVAAECGGENGEARTITVRTACGTVQIPATEGFEDAGALTCWQVYGNGYYTGRSTGAAHSGSASFLFFYTYSGSEYIVSPRLGGTDDGMRLKFYYKRYSSYYSEGFKVGYSTTDDGDSSFVWGETITDPSDEWQLFDAIYPAGVKYIAIDYTTTENYGIYIDDINFMLPPDCMPVSLLMTDTASEMGATSATLIWEPGSDDQNRWYVMLDSTVYEANAASYTLTDLSPRTTYTAYVAADCMGDTSEWQSVTFTTGCPDGECVMEVTSSNVEYPSYAYASPTLDVYQNGELAATVWAETKQISVCEGMPVVVLYTVPNYTYYTPIATVVDGGGAELFDGNTSDYSTGDTLAYLSQPCPSCMTPSGVMVAEVDSAAITFVWTVDYDVLQYQVSFNGGAWVTPATAGVYQSYGLDPDSLYTFSVRAICEVGDTSYTRTVSARTTCGMMTVPYSEGFEGGVDGERPACWYTVQGDPVVGDGANTGNNSMALTCNNNVPVMVASQPIPLPGDSIYVSFWARGGSYSYYAGTIEVGMMTNPLFDTTFVTMVTISSTDYAMYEFNTSTLNHDSTYYLAFRYTNSSNYYHADIDDINVRLDEGCLYPASLVATPSTSVPQVTVTWVNNAALSDFVVCYRQGTGDWSTPVDVMGTTYTFTGLGYSSTYEFRVGLICGTDTLWSSVSASTMCGVQSLPYYENFYSATGELPPCWDFTNSSYFHWNRWTTHAESSGDGEMMAGTGSAGEAAILPEFSAPIGKIEISFDAKLGSYSEGDGMMMGVYDDATSTVTWLDTLADVDQGRENFLRFTYNYRNYTGGYGNRIAIGHSHNNPSDWGFAIDSIVVQELPDCNAPENVTVNNSRYPNTADDVYFTWTVSGDFAPTMWQLYIDTVTSTTPIDSVDESLLISTDTTYYHVPVNMLAEGAHYRFFVRSVCAEGIMYSNWVELQNGFATDEFWMNQSSAFDTITGCDFIIYDNGGPVAGYQHNSNSNLIIQAGETGRELQLQGGFFSHGDDANTFTVYDGMGTSGEVLYTRNNTGMSETIDSVLATTTTGAMTITFTSGYYAALGYELYIHCVGAATCPRPTNLAVEMTSPTTAHATWDATGAGSYRVYHRVEGASVWNMLGTTTNSVDFTALPVDTNYEFCVVAVCTATDTSAPSIIRHFNTHYVEPCEAVENITVEATTTTAVVDWTSTGSLWEIEVIGGETVSTSVKPYTLTDLTAGTEYGIRVRNVCDDENELYSDWSEVFTFTTQNVVMYTITVNANNDAWGSVSGGGVFEEGTTTVITATANAGYTFVKWQDDDVNAIRTITVTADALYTAIFAEGTGVDDIDGNASIALYPNPASTSVTIDVAGFTGTAIVSIVDLNGRNCGEWKTENGKVVVDLSSFASGAYFVRVAGENANAVRKLVVK